MEEMERRVFMKGASMGMLAFAIGGVETLMTPGEARARAVPFRLLNTEEAETLEALGETLLPGAREAGVAHPDDDVVVPPQSQTERVESRAEVGAGGRHPHVDRGGAEGRFHASPR